jgi:hypothetical protein
LKIQFLIDGKEPQPRLGIVECVIRESINRVSRIDLSLASTAEITEEECEDLLGKRLALLIGDVVDGELLWSRFDAVIFECRIPDRGRIIDGFYRYALVARPSLWRLHFELRSKSYTDKSAVEVVEEVLTAHGFRKDVDFKTAYQSTGYYLKLNQILQTEMTDLAFVQQLLRESGINYYFGCDKSGQQEQILHLIDNAVFFPKPHASPISLLQSLAGRDTARRARHIASLDTRIQSVPSSVVATTNLGDGLERSFEYSRDVEKGTHGTHRVFLRHGQEPVAKHASIVLAQAFESLRTVYDGRSNHFLIRAGEKISVKQELGGEPKELLVFSAVHRLAQNAVVSLGDNLDPLYECRFAATRGDVEYRPSFLGPHQVPLDEFCETVPQDECWTQHPTQEVQGPTLPFHRLARESEYSPRIQGGVMVGTVTQDAYLSDNLELVCKLSNDAFAADIVARIALGWLSEMGWASFLPRVGMQVYFLLTQGAGGQNEAVVIGYRPTATHKTLDPAGTTETKKLAVKTPPTLGSAAEEVVVPATYAPLNRQRNTLLGEQGAAEVAIIDGGEDSVAIHAAKGVHIVAEAEVHVCGPSVCERADTLSQQFGTVERGVSGDQKESIGGDFELTVMGDETRAIQGRSRTEVQGNIEAVSDEKSSIVLQCGENTKLELSKDKFIGLASGSKNGIVIHSDQGRFTTSKGIVLSVGDKLKVDLNAEGDSIVIDRDGDLIEMTTEGVKIKTNNVTVEGMKIAIQGTQIELAGSMVTVSGSVIKLN